MIGIVLLAVVACFPISEVALAVLKRSGGGAIRDEDRGSMRLLWGTIGLSVAAAVILKDSHVGRITWPPHVIRLVALGLLVGGLAIRWIAIVTLGPLFTVDIAIHPDHVVMQ